MALSNELRASLERLNYGSESVEVVMGTPSADNRFARALEALEALSVAHAVPIAIVGGLAAIHYGYPAVTEDIDIAVARDQLQTLVEVAPRFGFRVAWEAPSGWHTLVYGDVEINVVPEGGKARKLAPTTIPGPTMMGVVTGVGYASLSSWVELKLSSNRRKDLTHVVEVLKTCDRNQIEAIAKDLAESHEQYREQFDRLAIEAEHERNQEDERS